MNTETNKSSWTNVNSYFSWSKKEEQGYKLNMDDDLEAGDQTSMLQKMKVNVSSSIEVEASYKSFFIVLAIGLGFIFFSFLFLPFVVVYPQKFLSFFSIGSFIILSSFIFVHGTVNYIKMLFNESRYLITTLYIASIILGFYFAFIRGSFIFSLISAIIQMVILIIFTLTFIPGGHTGISFILSMVSSPIKGLFTRN